MVEIKKKAWPEMFNAVLSGKKNFDLRLGDSEFKEGDVLILEEWDPNKKQHTGRKIEKKIRFVLKTKDLEFWTKEETDKYGYIVLGL